MLAGDEEAPKRVNGHGKTSYGAVGARSPRLLVLPDLAQLVGATEVVAMPAEEQASELDGVVVWGPVGDQGPRSSYARRHGLREIGVQPGLLRSVGLDGSAESPLSLLVDEVGDLWDTSRPSRFELLLESAWELDEPGRERAARCMASMRRYGVSRDNHAPPGLELDGPERARVLVVDQGRRDPTLAASGADPECFERMLRAALTDHPDAEIVIARFADAWETPSRGHLEDADDPRIRRVRATVHPPELLARVDAVYTVGSLFGLEALISGKPVCCFGAPFYAGWGLTDDRSGKLARTRRRTLEEVFAAAYLECSRYLSPETRAPCEIEDVLLHLGLQREAFLRNRGTIFCFGFLPWKQGYVRAYLRSPGNSVTFPWTTRAAVRRGFDRPARVLVWGMRDRRSVKSLAARHGVPVWRMEDGFLRSVGLGSDRTVPASLVVDQQGIYFDPTRPSDLESILERETFTDQELARARALRELIVTTGISKYNLGDRNTRLERPRDARRVVLVPGQVEDDASIQLGCEDVRTNEGLLRVARERAPDAFLVFKPHPDVTSGNRRGAVPDSVARRHADLVVYDAPLPACLAIADEVHTMTSLVGFEALLRGLAVYAYGRPFYAGWGLTTDRHAIPRRTRRLSLDELVAGTLLRYPRYLSMRTGRFTTPETVIAELRDEMTRGNTRIREPLAWRELRKAWNAVRGMLDVV